VAQAKARAGLTADRAVQEGVQMHGGIGVIDELDLGLFMKRGGAGATRTVRRCGLPDGSRGS
jgi:alkylation response protein AidB-like acyl-CoA dehydrogenase